VREAGYTAVTSDPRGIEADGNLDGNSPSDNTQSVFTINGVTIQNRGNNVEFSDLIKIRRGATATITNALVGTFGTATAADFIDMEDSKGNATAASRVTVTATGTADGTDIKNAPGATITVNGSQTGANATAFAWTAYNFQQ
jgi:hypothetical protein